MYKYKIRLDTLTDIGRFVLIASDVKSPVYITFGKLCVSGKSFLGIAHAKEFSEMYCECEENIYTKIQDFIVNE